MADSKISNLPAASVPLTGAEIVPLVQSGVTSQASVSNLTPGIGRRVVTVADATSITPNVNTSDVVYQSNTQIAGTLTINAVTGTPVDGQRFMIRMKCTNSQTFSWDTSYVGSSDLNLPTTTTGSSKYDYVGFIYNSAAVKWQMVAKVFGF